MRAGHRVDRRVYLFLRVSPRLCHDVSALPALVRMLSHVPLVVHILHELCVSLPRGR